MSSKREAFTGIKEEQTEEFHSADSPFPFNWKNSGMNTDFNSAESKSKFNIGKTKPKNRYKRRSEPKQRGFGLFFQKASAGFTPGDSFFSNLKQNLDFGTTD